MQGAAPEKRMGEEVELSGRAQKCHVDLTESPIDQVKQWDQSLSLEEFVFKRWPILGAHTVDQSLAGVAL